MRILHLTPELPFAPGGGGGQTHEFFLLRRLAELGHDVLNISPAEPRWMAHTDALREVGVRNWVAPRPASQPLEAARALLEDPCVLATALTGPVRALEMRVFWRRLAPLVQRAIAEHRPEVVVVGHDMAAAWAQAIPREIPAVLTLHNLTWRWYESRARLAGGSRAALLRAEGARYRRHVLRTLDRYDLLLPVSTQEADELRALTAKRVELLPIGVDTQVLAPTPDAGADPPRFLFTGTMSYPPNAEGARWLAAEVWPLVRAQLPQAQLTIVGKDPPAAVKALDGRAGIEVAGFVESMVPYFEQATAVLVPIRTGAGIRVKIIEAMSAGRAIVSTSLGWEGMVGVESGRHLLVADAPADFAAAAVRLIGEPQTRTAMAGAARELAVREYDWRSLGNRLGELLDSCTSR